jgi:hypothetical protein
MSSAVEFQWSVWDRSNKVSWTFNGHMIVKEFGSPPLSVAWLPVAALVAVVVSPLEAEDNLNFFAPTGAPIRALGLMGIEGAHFTWVNELSDGIVQAGYQTSQPGDWAATLNLETGQLTSPHRSY